MFSFTSSTSSSSRKDKQRNNNENEQRNEEEKVSADHRMLREFDIQCTFIASLEDADLAKEGFEQEMHQKKLLELQRNISETLGCDGSMREAVKLPKGEDEEEWIAANVCDFFNAQQFLFDMVQEHCTERTCEVMSAGPKFEYRWADDDRVKVPISVSAPEYVGLLFRWIEKQIDDERVFPKARGAQFPKDFKKKAKKICTRLFRVYAHLYHSHFKIICALSAEKHLNTIFKHFVYFAVEFSLISHEEMLPLRELVDGILAKE